MAGLWTGNDTLKCLPLPLRQRDNIIDFSHVHSVDRVVLNALSRTSKDEDRWTSKEEEVAGHSKKRFGSRQLFNFDALNILSVVGVAAYNGPLWRVLAELW